MFKLILLYGVFKLLSEMTTIKRKYLILAFVVINIFTLTFVYNTVFSESGYQALLSNHIRLEDARAHHSNENQLVFASGKIEGQSLLRDEKFAVESKSLLLIRKISSKYYKTFKCPNAGESSTRQCGEYRWKVKSRHYEYSANAKLQEVGFSNQLLKELAIGTGTKKVNIDVLDLKTLALFDSRRAFIRKGSIYFSDDRSQDKTGDLRVTFYQFTPKDVTFFARMKEGQLVALEKGAIAERINNYDRIYKNGIVQINHFLNKSQSNLTTGIYTTLGMAFVLLFLFVARYVNDYSKYQQIILPTLIVTLFNLLVLSSPLIFISFQ